MPHEFIEEEVNIYQFPSIDEVHKREPGIQITIGDLHGNAMKLMFMLIKHGIATNIDEDDYNKLAAIYQTTSLTEEQLVKFDKILSKITFSGDSLVRLIGDELADRGSNDYFTLRILEKLKEHNVPVEILVSNHGIEFIKAYENKEKNKFSSHALGPEQALSMKNLQGLVDQKMVKREEILAIIDKSYKPTLRAISYSLSENKNKKEITIYSHAGIGLRVINNLAKKLGLKYKDETDSELAQTIDNINMRFQEHVQNNTVRELYTDDAIIDVATLGDNDPEPDFSEAPLEYIIWNRRHENLDRPVNHSGYKIKFVHGHDSGDETKDNIYNLDNDLGKGKNSNEGIYTVLYSKGELRGYFLSQLEEIKNKAQDLINKGYTAAGRSAEALYDTVKNQHQDLIDGKIDIEAFQNSCIEAINSARVKLEKYRGWKQILGNTALAVAGAGIFYVIAGFIKKAVTGKFLFFKTDTMRKVDRLEKSVKSIKGPK